MKNQNDIATSCPNCWGRQSYQNQEIEATKEAWVDLKNISTKKGWIQAYAESNLYGLMRK